jgi:hypothetical protein
MRTPLRLIVLALTSALMALAFTVPASAATSPYCNITWGSLVKGDAQVGPGAGITVTDVRAGQHVCYDRLVIDLDVGGYQPSFRPSFRVEYVPSVTADASGQPVPLRGGAALLITLGAADYTLSGEPTYTPADRTQLVNVSGYRTFRQVAWAGSFEAVTSIGLGVRARLPFRAFTVAGPASGQTRLVVDVAHRW